MSSFKQYRILPKQMTTLLVIDWSSVGTKALQFILSFSILVTLHELGHFLTARLFKCRVEKFYLFFNPGFSIWKKKIGETEYGLGWVPFGGYVKIAGMIDESMDKEQMKLPPQPYEFRAKPAWQRLIIMTGGVIVNVILAIILFIFITNKWGEEYLPPQNMTWGIHADSLGRKIGLQDGDKIVSIDNKAIDNFLVVPKKIVLDNAKSMQVDRNGQRINISIPDNFANALNANKLAGFVTLRFPVIVDTVDKTKAHFLQNTHLQKGDRLIAVDNKPFTYFNQFDSLKQAYKNKAVALTVVRNTDTINVIAQLSQTASVGFIPNTDLFQTVKHNYSFFEAIPVGFQRCWETLGNYITGIRQIFAGKVKASDSLGSVMSIGNAFSGNLADWQGFWTLTAIFSIILAFMNILPIPALDGGHALFTLVEMITGRKPSDKFMEYAQMAGMVLLLALMAYAMGLDVWRFFFK